VHSAITTERPLHRVGSYAYAITGCSQPPIASHPPCDCSYLYRSPSTLGGAYRYPLHVPSTDLLAEVDRSGRLPVPASHPDTRKLLDLTTAGAQCASTHSSTVHCAIVVGSFPRTEQVRTSHGNVHPAKIPQYPMRVPSLVRHVRNVCNRVQPMKGARRSAPLRNCAATPPHRAPRIRADSITIPALIPPYSLCPSSLCNGASMHCVHLNAVGF
jgi:hypothetical protein